MIFTVGVCCTDLEFVNYIAVKMSLVFELCGVLFLLVIVITLIGSVLGGDVDVSSAKY